ncbi:MAG: histidine kinase dimerization/phospho-acceptor domain-containing protein, partial [Bdellovibrionota bacterium]
MLRLKAHAIAICLCLFSLIAVLGFKAYRVGRTHFDETRTLVESDFRSQELLLRMESAASAREQALRKYRVTEDPIYWELAERHGEIIQSSGIELKQSLGLSYPDLAEQAPSITNLKAMHDLGGELDRRRDQKLRHAREDALGILQLILLALVLSVGITAWLLTLFFKGLLEPLRTIKLATRRIREGELSHRIEPERGVTELRDVTRSFNSMAERLETLDQAKTEFLATVSHEIKNPLAALKEGLSLLANQGEVLTPPARQKSFSACLISAKRLEFLLNNLLHHSRMEAGL